MKNLRVRWSASASLDLIGIVEFIRNDRQEAARKVGREVREVTRRLRKNPMMGRIVPELHSHGIFDYRELSVPPYRIIYAVRAASVDIAAVIDGRRDLQAALFERLMREKYR